MKKQGKKHTKKLKVQLNTQLLENAPANIVEEEPNAVEKKVAVVAENVKDVVVAEVVRVKAEKDVNNLLFIKYN